MFSAATFANGTIKGKIFDADNNESLIGATIMLEGTTLGTTANLDGTFSFSAPAGNYTLIARFVGYAETKQEISLRDGQTLDVGDIKLSPDAIGLKEVAVVASIAIHRETPVAVSTIPATIIEEKLGTQEFPQILKSTPGVYATRSGGGFGDSRINIRGFDARNTATLINGVPVNDMESGWVYWSNWAGLADVTRSMQVQRGLGASRLALPSLGGTINVLTKTTDVVKGGNVYTGIGNDGLLNQGIALSTGLTDDGWASTILLNKKEGNGFVDGTEFQSYSYFFNLSKQINSNHTVTFTLFGAKQWHGQRRSRIGIADYEAQPSGYKYNRDWGYKDGQTTYLYKNFYHKPQAILNHFWTIDRNTSLMTSVYGSVGNGGGTGGYGENGKFTTYLREGQIDFDRIVDENIARGGQGGETILRASMNNHLWYGVISNFSHDRGNWTYSGGVDARYYIGEHYRKVEDLLGSQYFIDGGTDVNMLQKEVRTNDKIAYYNDGVVSWLGLFASAEYKKDNLSAFVTGSISNKAYKRVDYFNYFTDENIEAINNNPALKADYLAQLGENDFNEAMKGQETKWSNFFGYVLKGGANYNIDDNHNIFINAGMFERQPDFRAVYLLYKNILNNDAVNEKVKSFELGYGYRNHWLSLNVNVYRTQWNDKTFTRSIPIFDPVTNTEEWFSTSILGVNALHQGIELDFMMQPTDKLTLTGMFSIGDWRWLNNIEDAPVFDEDQNIAETVDVFIEDLPVGDAAQITAAFGMTYQLLDDFKFGFDYNYYDRLYALFDPLDRGALEGGIVPDSWELPAYGLFDIFAKYDFKIGDLKASLMGKVNNVFDEEYISDATDGTGHDWQSATVYYGWGRSWSVNLKIYF